MILDSNILIGYLNGESALVALLNEWKQSSRPLFVASISHAEVLALPTLSSDDVSKVRTFLHSFISISFDDTVAEVAASLKRTYHLSLPDAAIAASALVTGLPLVTRDVQFQKIKEITVLPV